MVVGLGVGFGVVGAGLVVAGADAEELGGVGVVTGTGDLAAAEVAGAADELLAAGVADDPRPVWADEQAVSATAVARTSRAAERGNHTRPGSHEMPMRIRGCVEGASQLMIETRLACGIATQPAVALPSVTCRKNALPAPT